MTGIHRRPKITSNYQSGMKCHSQTPVELVVGKVILETVSVHIPGENPLGSPRQDNPPGACGILGRGMGCLGGSPVEYHKDFLMPVIHPKDIENQQSRKQSL
jgi:hypothetical protein